jgi:hypothetical protein
MAWEAFRCDDGIYLVNWQGVSQILRSCARARAMTKNSEKKCVEKQFIGPDLWSVEVNWDKVRQETATNAEACFRKFHACARRSMQTELNWLVCQMEQADDDRDAFQDLMAAAQHQTMENIERSVHIGEIGVKAATIVRDVSAEFLMVGATYLTGGAGLVFIPIGSGIKGYGVYTDTGRSDKAVATFSTNLILGVADVGVGAKIAKSFTSKSARIGMAIVWAKTKSVLEVPKGLIEGKDLKEAACAGAVKMAASTPATAGVELLKDVLKVRELEPWAIPIEVVLNMAQDKGGEMLAKTGEKEPEVRPSQNQVPARLPHPHRNHHLMDSFLYDRSIIEQTAVQKVGSGPRG